MARAIDTILSRRLLAALTAAMLCIAAVAQNPDSIEEQMDSIKLSEDYVYGEKYANEEAGAFDLALTQLEFYANQMRREAGLPPLEAADLRPYVKVIDYTDGGRYAILLYVNKAQMLAMKPGAKPNEGATALATATVDSVATRPALVFQPWSQQPAATPPPVQQPVATAPAVSQSVTQLTQKLCDYDNWLEIKGFLSQSKSDGQIEVGRCTRASEVPADAYAILVDRWYGILSVLSPANVGNRVNCKTNKSDSEYNYKDCEVIVWYRSIH